MTVLSKKMIGRLGTKNKTMQVILIQDVDTLGQVFAKIEAVTAHQLLEISNEIFDNNLTTLVFEPKQ